MPIFLLAWFFVFGGAARAEEAILYQENFNGGQAAGWQEQADPGAIWQVRDEKYYLNIPVGTYSVGAKSIYQNGYAWQNYAFSFDAELNDGVDRNVIFRRQDEQNYYSLGLRGFWRYAPPDDTPVIYLQRCYQGQCVGDDYRNYFAAYHFTDVRALNYHEISHFDIEAIGSSTKIYYNHNLVITWQEPTDNYPKSGTIGFTGWSGHYGAADVAFDNLMVKTPSDEPAEPEPVILVPGIMGSWNAGGGWELDPIFHTYDNLWEALKNAGYKEGETLFAFPYQWRLSNSYTAELLKQKIQEVKGICHCEKVDLVAHSMGGLVARSYIEGSNYQNDIDQLIFLATPHNGSTKAYLMWEGGEFGPDPLDKLMQRILTVEADFNGYGSLFKYIRELPMQSVQELLPTYNYLRDKDSMQLRVYPSNYPVNTFLELLNNPFELQKLNGVRMINILADSGANSTVDNLRVVAKDSVDGEWAEGYPENYSLPFTDHGIEYGPGDDTVSERSNKDFSNLENIAINSSHSNIATDAQKRVIKELTGVEPAQEVRLNMFQKFFLVRIFSPADFVITAPGGKRLGKDFLSGQAVNEITGAFYSGFGTSAEFAVIPDPLDGEYTVELQGTGQGDYKLSASLIGDSQEIDKEFSGSIETGQERSFTVDYTAQAEDPIGELEPVDTVPPVITINKPIEGGKYLRSDDLIIDYSATDDFSGIAAVAITMDGQAVATTTIDLFDYSLGQHNLIIQAVDKSGNQAQKQVSIQVTASINSAIADINEIYNRGWLKSQIYKTLLIDAFKLLAIAIKSIDDQIAALQRLIDKAQADPSLKPIAKQKLISQYNSQIDALKIIRQKTIYASLGAIAKTLDAVKKYKLINQTGYDIMINDINYLRVNL